MQEDEILKLAQQGKTPFQIAEELMGDEDRVYLYTPVSWFVDPTVDEDALDKPPLSIEMNYYLSLIPLSRCRKLHSRIQQASPSHINEQVSFVTSSSPRTHSNTEATSQ